MGLSVTTDILTQRVDVVIEALTDAIGNPYTNRHDVDFIQDEARAECRELGLALLEDIFGREHRTYQTFEEKTNGHGIDDFRSALGTMRAVRRIVSGNWLAGTRSLIAEGVFSDYLDMADHLARERFHSAAVVIAIGSLEIHLRRLAEKNGIATETTDKAGYTRRKAAEALNAELKAKGAYSTSDQKQITAYVDIRNHAAHGEHEKVSTDNVPLILQWTRNFISRHFV